MVKKAKSLKNLLEITVITSYNTPIVKRSISSKENPQEQCGQCPGHFVQGNFYIMKCIMVLEVYVSVKDQEYMQMALQLAKKGCGFVAPNPMVGAVIVKDGRIIGQGWHKKYGEYHAERNALDSCTESPEGADMYVTLEPCCHQGKQPSCVDAILKAGIRRVVIGSGDPNPKVNGKGIQMLREQGVEVTENILQKECDELNEVFFHFIRTGKPFVVMKYAMTLDGKIAAYTGVSKWIIGEEAREHLHQQRHRYTAIMAGVGTILADDPLLTCRVEDGKNPIRIICDSSLRTPEDAKVVLTAKQVPTIIVTCCDDRERQLAYEEQGCRILLVGEKDNHVDMHELMEKLGNERIDSILMEGGGALNWIALKSGIVQKVQAYISPKLLGGKNASTPLDGKGAPTPDDAISLKNSRITCLGEDFLIESEVENDV